MTSPKRNSSILDLVGDTPLVPIRRLNPNPNVTLLAKLEANNPGGSVKDRVALKIIEAAEQSGELTSGKVILEATSGNTGIGLALVAAVKGYECVLAMSEAVSLERRKILSALGATFLLTKPELGTDGAIERVYRLIRSQPERYFMADQYNNPNNPLAHYDGTGREILEQTEGAVTHFVATMGTTGTLIGVSRRLKEANPKIQVIGVEPFLNHKIQGLKNLKEAYRPGIFDKKALDEKVNILDEHAFEMTRRLAYEEGIFAGMSSGAAMHVAVELAKTLESGVVVALLPDGGERYLSTPLFDVQAKQPQELTLHLTDITVRRKERFLPLFPNEARMYACGPTVDDHTHLGVCRRLLVADVLRRYLEWQGLSVKQVVNITDMDDRTINASEKQGLTLEELTTRHTEGFMEDMETLRVRPATNYVRASRALMEMVDFVNRLISKGAAYEKLRSVYFDLSAAKNYGRLSRLDLSKLRVGATVDLDDYEKENPRDFTLLKRSTLADLKRGIFYETPWGNVRPGWHLECAAIACRYLGNQYDIHVSSKDLIFPHLENKLAMCSVVHGKDPVNHWVLSGLIKHKGRKLARSAGDPAALRDLLQLGYSGREVRFFLLRTHYLKDLNLTEQALLECRRTLASLDRFIESLQQCPEGPCNPVLTRQLTDELTGGLREAMDSDLNLSMALASLIRVKKKTSRLLDEGKLGPDDSHKILNALRTLDTVLGFLDVPAQSAACDSSAWPSEVCDLVGAREEARSLCQWERADQIRERLGQMGYQVEDTPQGTRLV